MSEAEDKKKSADALMRDLDLSLAQKRMEWERSRAKLRVWRTLSFLFLFLVIAAGFFAFFLLYQRRSEMGTQVAPPDASATP